MGKHRESKRKPKREGKKISVGRVEDVPAGRGATVKLKNGAEVALFNAKGKFYAIENFCPHKGCPLADRVSSATRSNANFTAGVLTCEQAKVLPRKNARLNLTKS